MEHLLKQLEIIRLKYEMLNSTKEQFNIFSALHQPHDERRLHSRFIANLLSSDSSHRRGKLFLNKFLEIVNVNPDIFRQAEVFPTEDDKSEKDNIDILIIDYQAKNAIIIENKIYAGDSNNDKGGQLERYYNHIIDNKNINPDNIKTFYLTLDGHEPSDSSLGKYKTLENINGVCISYSNEILAWLEECLHLVYDSPFLRESIIQYKKLLETMTGNESNIEQRIELRNTIGKNTENLKNAKMLFDNFKHIKWHTVRDFWDELEDALTKNGYQVTEKPTDNNITDLTHYESYRKGQRNKQNVGIKFKNTNNNQFCIWNEHEDNDCFLYWGCEKKDVNNASITNIKIIESDQSYISNGRYFFWSYIFKKPSNYIALSDFTRQATFDLINNTKRKEAITAIINEINNKMKMLS